MFISVDACEYLLVGLALSVGRITWVSLTHGGLVSLCGLFMLIWCSGHSRPGKIEGGDVSGPWRFVRHPETVARFMMVFGIMLIARAPWVFAAAVVILGAQYRFVVSRGDAELNRWLGPSFAVYRLFVPSFLPQFLPARLPQHSMRVNVQESPWSLGKALKRRSVLMIVLSFLLSLGLFALVLHWDASPWWSRSVGFILTARGLWLLKSIFHRHSLRRAE